MWTVDSRSWKNSSSRVTKYTPSRNGVWFPGSSQCPEVIRQSRVVERTRPITVLTVYTGDPKHKVRPANIQPFVVSLSLPKDHSDSVVSRQFINISRGASGMGQGRPSPSQGWCTPQRGTHALSCRFTCLTIVFQDRTRDTYGDLTGKLPLRLHHCPDTGRELPPCQRATVDEYKPTPDGMQRSECINTPETWVNLQTCASRDSS